MDDRIEGVLKFWFGPPDEGEERPTGEQLWFQADTRVDRLIEERFGDLVEKAKAGQLDGWANQPRGRLALIIVLDQLNRNVHRDSPEAFAGDDKALALCFDGLDDDVDKKLSLIERAFFYMPCSHAEDTDAQLAGVEVFESLLDDAPPEQKKTIRGFLQRAQKHRDIVERFERFPHRNGILGRQSTPEESAFLQHSGQLV